MLFGSAGALGEARTEDIEGTLVRPDDGREAIRIALLFFGLPDIVIPIVIVLTMLTVVVAAAVVAPRTLPRAVIFRDMSDPPVSFGRDMIWLAVKTRDKDRLCACLGVRNPHPANWDSGIGTIYDSKLGDRFAFVTPPVHDWTIVASTALPIMSGHAFADKLTPLLRTLAQEFSEVQYFAALPIIDHFAWVRLERGRVVRACAFGDGGPIWKVGRATSIERRLGLRHFDVRGIENRRGDAGGALQIGPTVGHVLNVAEAWSVSPMNLANRGTATPAGVGAIISAPVAWRAARALIAA